MTTNYTHILDLAKEAEPPADGILSRTIFQDDKIKAAVFGFAHLIQQQEDHDPMRCCRAISTSRPTSSE